MAIWWIEKVGEWRFIVLWLFNVGFIICINSFLEDFATGECRDSVYLREKFSGDQELRQLHSINNGNFAGT